jgi:hypothetical protein
MGWVKAVKFGFVFQKSCALGRLPTAACVFSLPHYSTGLQLFSIRAFGKRSLKELGGGGGCKKVISDFQ